MLCLILLAIAIVLWLIRQKEEKIPVVTELGCDITGSVLSEDETVNTLSYLGHNAQKGSTIGLKYSVGISNGAGYALKNFWIDLVVPNYMIPFVVYVTDNGITMDVPPKNENIPSSFSYAHLFIRKDPRFENPGMFDGILFLAHWHDINWKKAYKICEVSK